VTKKTDFGNGENLIFTTPSGLWIIIGDCAYKLKDPIIDDFEFKYGNKRNDYSKNNFFPVSCSTVSINRDFFMSNIEFENENEESDDKKISISLKISSNVAETAHIDKLHEIFDIEDVKGVSKIMNKKFNDMGEIKW